ncbi:hypothetical protein D3874_04820 [Oleomonas cavernae]|uniref:Uncharacterized protein n=1 Tax=Oleomonas cavernae TaxID=2320859 RepID=A0A418W8V6_9PROT|nr:hypothetical protein [Oleomonas cavernae]RJF86432.1 hypothetical protein D3874_04820 [Oleomonas cavernae]
MADSSIPIRIWPATLEAARGLFPDDPTPLAIAKSVEVAVLLSRLDHMKQQLFDKIVAAFVERIDRRLEPVAALFETVLRHQGENDRRVANLLNEILDKLVSAPAPDGSSLQAMFANLIREIQQLSVYLQHLQPRR